MVKLYREKNSLQADIVEAELRDMTFGYDCEVMDPDEAVRKFGPQHFLPVITNNEIVVSGEGIPGYIKVLKTFREDWQAFQSDCCYVDDGGEVI